MAYISYFKMWESGFVNIVLKKDKVQDININQIKLEVHDFFKKKMKKSQQILNPLMTQML